MLKACCSYTSLSLLMSPFSFLLRHAFFSCRLLSGSLFAWSVAALHLDSETIKLMFLIYEQIVAESIIPLSVLVLFSITVLHSICFHLIVIFSNASYNAAGLRCHLYTLKGFSCFFTEWILSDLHFKAK